MLQHTDAAMQREHAHKETVSLMWEDLEKKSLGVRYDKPAKGP